MPRYMSGPKADMILARSSDPSVKKRRKKHKNEDYIGGGSHGNGLVKDEDDEAFRQRNEDVLDGPDAPGEPLFLLALCAMSDSF